MRNDCLDLGSNNDNIWREVDGFEVFRDGTDSELSVGKGIWTFVLSN